MENNKINSWNDVETFTSNIINQAKKRARLWFVAFLVAMSALVVTNICWAHQFSKHINIETTK